jgi:hypothetical protein
LELQRPVILSAASARRISRECFRFQCRCAALRPIHWFLVEEPRWQQLSPNHRGRSFARRGGLRMTALQRGILPFLLDVVPSLFGTRYHFSQTHGYAPFLEPGQVQIQDCRSRTDLEIQLQPKLHQPRIVHRRVHRAEAGCVEIADRLTELRVVKQVEEFRPEMQVHILPRQPELLDH